MHFSHSIAAYHLIKPDVPTCKPLAALALRCLDLIHLYPVQGQAQTVSMWGNVQAGGYFDDQEVELIDDPRYPGTDRVSSISIVDWDYSDYNSYGTMMYNALTCH